MRHVVIGAGQVGTAIAAVLRHDPENDVELVDLIGDFRDENADMLHICFPWSESFETDVQEYIDKYRPWDCVIHSTVPVGTSRRLGVVHSPVTGVHPNLEVSIFTFTKFFGGQDAFEVADVFKRCGVKVRAVPDQETTEAGKLWQTLQYGWQIALQKEAFRFMKEHGADPSVAYTEMNDAYNEGYAKFGTPYHITNLKDMPGPIGGHCVIPNLKLTPTQVSLWLAELNGWYK